MCITPVTFCATLRCCFFWHPFPPAISMRVPVRRPSFSQHAMEGGCWRGSPANASARSSCRAGLGPPALHSPPGGNSSRDAAKARCAATARMPTRLTTHAALAAARREVGTSAARAQASKRMKVAASGAHLPPTSSPNTTRRQRRARSSSG